MSQVARYQLWQEVFCKFCLALYIAIAKRDKTLRSRLDRELPYGHFSYNAKLWCLCWTKPFNLFVGYAIATIDQQDY